jgi:hypothetical protein
VMIMTDMNDARSYIVEWHVILSAYGICCGE